MNRFKWLLLPAFAVALAAGAPWPNRPPYTGDIQIVTEYGPGRCTYGSSIRTTIYADGGLLEQPNTPPGYDEYWHATGEVFCTFQSTAVLVQPTNDSLDDLQSEVAGILIESGFTRRYENRETPHDGGFGPPSGADAGHPGLDAGAKFSCRAVTGNPTVTVVRCGRPNM